MQPDRNTSEADRPRATAEALRSVLQRADARLQIRRAVRQQGIGRVPVRLWLTLPLAATLAAALVLGWAQLSYVLTVHAFGLSTRIQHLPLPERGLVTHILAFNAGVELGQITALTTTAWGLALVRKDANDFGPLSR